MFKASIIGGNWGARNHLSAIQRLGAEVTFIVTRSGASRFANEIPAPPVTKDLRKAFDACHIVAIASPWYCHEDHLRAGINRGCPILVEHPLASTFNRAEEIASISSQARIPIFVNLPTRYLLSSQLLREFVANGPFCNSENTIQVEHRFRIPHDEEVHWIPLLLYHSLDLALWLFKDLKLVDSSMSFANGEISEVPSWSWPLLKPGDQNTALLVSCIQGNLASKGVKYHLSLGMGDDDGDFVETVSMVCGGKRILVGTRLQRESEFSPWRLLDPWIGDETAPVEIMWQNSTRDVWLDANNENWRAIAVEMGFPITDGRRPIEPAKVDHALNIHRLVDNILRNAGETAT